MRVTVAKEKFFREPIPEDMKTLKALWENVCTALGPERVPLGPCVFCDSMSETKDGPTDYLFTCVLCKMSHHPSCTRDAALRCNAKRHINSYLPLTKLDVPVEFRQERLRCMLCNMFAKACCL